MRRILSFDCEGVKLAATLDEASGDRGLLIVSGGNEIRAGAHRGMAKLAREIAAQGYPVLRFDRRGIGDSEGENGGFRSSGPDINAALEAFYALCPNLEMVASFGNCDAATALVLNETKAKALILANPWVIEPVDDLPPAAAIKDRYWQLLRDPKSWVRLLTGAIDLGKAFRGIKRIVALQKVSSLAQDFQTSLKRNPLSPDLTILLAEGDATAIAFRHAVNLDGLKARMTDQIELVQIASNSHSFAGDADYAVLKSTILKALGSV